MRKLSINTDKIIAVIFVTLIVLNNTLGLDPVYYNIPKIAMLVFFVLMAIVVVKRGKLVYSRNLILPIVFFVLETLSILWAYDRETSASKWVTQAQLFVLFIFVYYYMRDKGSLKLFLIATYISGFALIAYSFVRYGVAGFFLEMLSGARLGGEITNENTYGLTFSYAAVVAFYFFVLKKNKWHIISACILSVFALSSGSKKALFMIIGGIIVISLLAYGIKQIWKTLLVLGFLALCFIIVINLPMFNGIVKRVQEFFSEEQNASDRHRETFRLAGYELIKKRPILGYGIFGFSKATGIGTYSHDNFVEVAVSTGIIGLIVYYIPLLYSFFYLLRKVIKRDMEALILLSFVFSQIIFGYGQVQFMGRFVWILLGITLAYIDKSKTTLRSGEGIDDDKSFSSKKL